MTQPSQLGFVFTESMTSHRQTTGQHDHSLTMFIHRQPTHSQGVH